MERSLLAAGGSSTSITGIYCENGTAYYNTIVHSSDEWWADKVYEFVFMEEIVLTVFIATAVIFETIHHHIQHRVHHRGIQFFTTTLWHRMNSEFMVLGFLAFLVWLSSRSGLLKAAVDKQDESALGPNDKYQLLHQMEDVHMRLFMSMCLYFTIIIGIGLRAERMMRGWCHHWETRELKKRGLTVSDESSSTDTGNKWLSNTEIRHYNIMEAKFAEFLEEMEVDKVVIGKRTLTEPEVRVYLENFNFAAYLTKSMEEIMGEIVHVNVWTWIGVGCFMIVMALTSGYAHTSDNGELYKIVAIQYAVVLLLIALVIFVFVTYSWAVDPDSWWDSDFGKWLGKYRTEIIFIRVLQVFVFFCCYAILFLATSLPATKYLGSKAETHIPLFIFCYVVPFMVMVYFVIPNVLPKFNVVMRVPPFVDNEDKHTIVAVAMGKYHRGYLPRLYPKTHHDEHDDTGGHSIILSDSDSGDVSHLSEWSEEMSEKVHKGPKKNNKGGKKASKKSKKRDESSASESTGYELSEVVSSS